MAHSIDQSSQGCKIRSSGNGGSTWTSWYEVWTAATDGNHGRAVAWTAKQLGQKAVIYMPADSVPARIEAILARTPEVRTWSRRTGAELGPAAATAANRSRVPSAFGSIR